MFSFYRDGQLLALFYKSLGYLVSVGLAVFVYRLYHMRMLVRRAHKEHGVPIIPHSFFFGHLIVVTKLLIRRKLPRDLHGHWMFVLLREEFPEVAKCGVIYFDVWPMNFPMVAVLHPEMISQFVISPSLPKFWYMREVEFHHFSGGADLVTSDGPEWKEQRAIYGPSFSGSNVTAMTSWFAEEVLVFRARLLEAANSQMTIELEEYSKDLTFDVIARAVFNARTKAQEQAAPVWLDTLRRQIALLYFVLEPRKMLDFTMRYKHWKHNRTFKSAISPLIHAACAANAGVDGPKTIINLAVKPFVGKEGQLPPDMVDKTVKNIKMFLFAGHETTSSTIAMMYYVLSRNPEKLAVLRAELDEVLGPNPANAADTIRANHAILNKLRYTNAVIRELLRMYPPVGGSIRQSSSPDFKLTNPQTGMRFPTEGFIIHSSAVALGRDPEYWYRPDEFIPERFMTHDENDPLYPLKHAWQPFSLGPRACIGQELVYLEIKLTLALTVREVDIMPDYPADAPMFFGQAAYQVSDPDSIPSARIKDRMPVKIRRRQA